MSRSRSAPRAGSTRAGSARIGSGRAANRSERSGSPEFDGESAVPTLIGALLRVPAQAIQRQLITGLNASGFPDLRLPHMAVLQYPGPNGCRPLDLARRAGMSKQAMNQLLNSLEQLGYVSRTDADDDGRARSVHFTERGEAVWTRMVELLVTEEAEWRKHLGDGRFRTLKALLGDVWYFELARRERGAR